jgi:hypothetical protein
VMRLRRFIPLDQVTARRHLDDLRRGRCRRDRVCDRSRRGALWAQQSWAPVLEPE